MMQKMTGTAGASQRGFTLIEIMIVVAIIGILVAFAFPRYQEHTMKSRRSEGRTLLTQIAAQQEQFFQNNQRYSNDFTELGTLSASAVAAGLVTSENGYYDIAFSATGTYTYTLQATPRGAQAGDKCTSLSLDQENTKTFTLTPGAAADCW